MVSKERSFSIGALIVLAGFIAYQDNAFKFRDFVDGVRGRVGLGDYYPIDSDKTLDRRFRDYYLGRVREV